MRCAAALLALSAVCSHSTCAETPIPIEKVAKVDVLVFEADERIAELEKLFSSEDAYDQGTELAVPSAAGVLACIGQAIELHKEKPKDINSSGLRDAALAIAEAGDLDEAKTALAKLKEARSGKGEPGEKAADVSFGTLIGGYELMEEINTRNSRIARVARRPRGKPEEAAHAAVIALLCLPMHDQAEDYVDEEDVADYQKLSIEYLNQLAEMSAAITKKDSATVKKLLLASKQTCDTCHKKYRDGE